MDKEQIILPSDESIKDMKAVLRALTNNNSRAIIEYLAENGASSISEIADHVDIPYRTLQTNQYYMIGSGMLEYREKYDDKDRKVLWFTNRFKLAIEFIGDHDETIKQYLDNQTKHNVNGTRFRR